MSELSRIGQDKGATFRAQFRSASVEAKLSYEPARLIAIGILVAAVLLCVPRIIRAARAPRHLPPP